jgi:hypothetical protein
MWGVAMIRDHETRRMIANRCHTPYPAELPDDGPAR